MYRFGRVVVVDAITTSGAANTTVNLVHIVVFLFRLWIIIGGVVPAVQWLLMKMDGVAGLGPHEAIPLGVFGLEPVSAVGAVRCSAIGKWRTVRVDVKWPGGISRPCVCVTHSCIEHVDILLG